MTSNENVLQNFEYEYDGTVSIVRGVGYQGTGISRTIFLHPENVQDIPEELFAIKVSKSTNPQKANKFVFRFLSYRLEKDQKPSDLVPGGIDMTTPLADLKAAFVSKMATLPDASVSLNINLKGTFTNIACADAVIKLYDESEPEFKTEDPNTTGNAPYYIKPDAQIHVKLKGAMSKQGNPYIQTTLSTVGTSDQVLTRPQKGSIWKADENAGSGVAADASAADGCNPVW